MDYKIVAVFIFFLFGVLLLGKGITGFMVISQSCCAPGEYCDPDAVCGEYDINNPKIEMIDFIAGFSLLLIGYFIFRYKAH